MGDDKRRPGEGHDSDTHRVETPPPPAPREERPSAGGANLQRIGCGVLALLALPVIGLAILNIPGLVAGVVLGIVILVALLRLRP